MVVGWYWVPPTPPLILSSLSQNLATPCPGGCLSPPFVLQASQGVAGVSRPQQWRGGGWGVFPPPQQPVLPPVGEKLLVALSPQEKAASSSAGDTGAPAPGVPPLRPVLPPQLGQELLLGLPAPVGASSPLRRDGHGCCSFCQSSSLSREAPTGLFHPQLLLFLESSSQSSRPRQGHVLRASLGDRVALALPECTRPRGVSLANGYRYSCWVFDLSSLFHSVSLGSASEDVIVPCLCEMCGLWWVG